MKNKNKSNQAPAWYDPAQGRRISALKKPQRLDCGHVASAGQSCWRDPDSGCMVCEQCHTPIANHQATSKRREAEQAQAKARAWAVTWKGGDL